MTTRTTNRIYRIALFMLLFGLSSLSYAGNFDNPLLNALSNISPLVSIGVFMVCYFSYPGFYKLIAWLLLLGVLLLLLESKYEYNQFVYSYFVIKRFAYCGVALLAYHVVGKAGPLKIEYAVYIILGLFFVNQILLGQIFRYNFTSETRTTFSTDALYLVIPFLYYLTLYLKEHRLVHFFGSLVILLIIVFLLHRTVISAAVVAAGLVFGLAVLGKVSTTPLPIGRTFVTFLLIVLVATPFSDLLPESKMTSAIENIGGIFAPKEDNTGSWRMEQGEYYLSKVPERPILGWRYDGYDRGEIMPNDDFPDKGTIIHSQYVDMLYNYGYAGLLINLTLMVGALIALYRSGRKMSIDNVVLFGFILSGMVFGISYQTPIYYWAFVGMSTYLGLHPPVTYFDGHDSADEADADEYDSSRRITLEPRS